MKAMLELLSLSTKVEMIFFKASTVLSEELEEPKPKDTPS